VAFVLNMKNMVPCQACEWHLKNSPERDWDKDPCSKCKNTRQVIDPKEILCNLCGECMCPLGTMNEQYPHGLYKAKVDGGYDSYHLWDMTQYTFSFCEKCLRQLFMQCKIKPTVNELNFGNNTEGLPFIDVGDESSWEQDQTSYEYRVWVDSGGFKQAYLNKKCNSEKDCPNKAVYTVYMYEEFTEECCCEEHKARFNNSRIYKLVPFIANVYKPYL